MASLKDIKRKIKSVQNTQKTTNAMKLVSVAKLKKAEEAAKKSKLYAQKIRDILSEISYKIHKYGSAISNPKFYDWTLLPLFGQTPHFHIHSCLLRVGNPEKQRPGAFCTWVSFSASSW